MLIQEKNPPDQLTQIFRNEGSLEELPEVLSYLSQHKIKLDSEINNEIKSFRKPISLEDDVEELVNGVSKIRNDSSKAQETIFNTTSYIQKLDNCKKNLVSLMTVLQRLQMLSDVNNSLHEIVPTKNYKEIVQKLGALKELLKFFRSYKSIEEINKVNTRLTKEQNKLVDDIFIDFEDAVVNKTAKDQLVYGCNILELVDPKNKNKLLSWFYNLQLKEIQNVFSSRDEAGSLENINRRYIYFNNTLSDVHRSYLGLFPKEWKVDLELSKLFCDLTREEVRNQLNDNVQPNILLDTLMITLEFEKNLNLLFHTNEFDRIILKLFQPYMHIWVKEQDNVVNRKFMEFYSRSQLPEEYSSVKSYEDLVALLKINNVPNISTSAVEIFKLYHRLFSSALRFGNGEILVGIFKVFVKYLRQFYSKAMLPMIPHDVEHLVGVEPVKYLTMMLNTGDYIINNIGELEEKFSNTIDERYKSQVSFESSGEMFYHLINVSIQFLLNKILYDLKFPWRQFVNNNWKNMEKIGPLSNYMIDYKQYLSRDCTAIFPIIIRESYIKNLSYKLVEAVVTSFLNNIKLLGPLSIVNLEQIKNDIENLKTLMDDLPLYSNPNRDTSINVQVSETSLKSYRRHVNSQFDKLFALLRILMVPILPINHFILSYFDIIGDRSVSHFLKVLSYKFLDNSAKHQYIDAFKDQASYQNTLPEESQLLSGIADIEEVAPNASIEELRSDEKGTKSPTLFPTTFQINNIEKNLRDFAFSGDGHVSRLRNFGKFFSKEGTHG